MARSTLQADIIVGIDFGMTCTGVAYSYGPEWPSPKTIQRWPGKLGREIRNKVDSAITYRLSDGQPAAWGFLCNPDDEAFEYNSLFKLYLDPHHKDSVPDPPSNEEARKWFKDYLRFLYNFLMDYFGSSYAHFDNKIVDFVFSVPVTWRSNPTLISDIEALAYMAGFGSRTRDSINVYLTEAEAAAVYASRGSLAKDDVFLVCDAGGGTMDLNVLKVASAESGGMELYPLSWTEGASIGSTLIDFRIRSMVKLRLEAVREYLDDDLLDVTTRMMAGGFEEFKCSFGSHGMEVPRLAMPIPGLKTDVNFPQHGIEDSRIIITRADMQQVFDGQVDRMCALVDKQLNLVRERHPYDPVNYLILSGGLGSSPYIRSRIQARYEGRVGKTQFRSNKLEVLLSDEPQLAVCHGLVIARAQYNISLNEVMSRRCCPVSFGILTREPYDPLKHEGESFVQDPHDKITWAVGQINWILKQGQVVRADYGVTERYTINIEMGREFEPWTTTIVMSPLPANRLPKSMKWGGASVICSVEAVLNPSDMKRKNRHWYNLGTEYNRAEFLVRMLVSTGLRFEIWSMDGKMRSRGHEEIVVQWVNPDAATMKSPSLDRYDAGSPQPSELSGIGIRYELETEVIRAGRL